MKSRNIMISAVAVALAAVLFFLLALIRQSRGRVTEGVSPRADLILELPEPEPDAVVDYSGIAATDLFSRERGKVPEPPPVKEEEKATLAAEETITMLSSYPNEWPRLKLTGVFVLDGRPGAVISGGDALPVSSGDKFARLYRVGEHIGGGVSLGSVRERSVIIKSSAGGWEIWLGAEPPVVPKK